MSTTFPSGFDQVIDERASGQAEPLGERLERTWLEVRALFAERNFRNVLVLAFGVMLSGTAYWTSATIEVCIPFFSVFTNEPLFSEMV